MRAMKKDIDTFLQDVIHSKGGLVQRLARVPSGPGNPRMHRYLAVIKYRTASGEIFNITGSGCSLDETASKMSALGEAIERYSSRWIFADDLVMASAQELEGKVLDLARITRLNAQDYVFEPGLRNVDDTTQMYWTAGVEWGTGEDVWLPFETVFLSIPPYKPFRDIISTGLACGASLEDAIRGGFCECIERDAFVLFWMLGEVRFQLELTSIDDAEIRALMQAARRSHLELAVYDITNDTEVPTILTVVRRPGNAGFYMGCAAHPSYRIALFKSLVEGLGGFSVYSERIHSEREVVPDSMEGIKTLDDHVLYYMSGKYDSILDELLPTSIPVRAGEELLTQSMTIEEMIARVQTQGHPVYYKELTTVDVRELGLHVVRVVCPSLAFLPIGTPMLNCERLQQKRGDLQREFNLAPHPFP